MLFHRRNILLSRNHKKVVEYRNYYLPNNFPVLLLTGPKWIISPVASSTLHFHNCLELGYCHEGSGTLEFGNGKSIHFSAGDVTCIPRNIPHTTYSDRDALSRWSWIFLQPERLFPNSALHAINATLFQHPPDSYIVPNEMVPRGSLLMEASIEELAVADVDHHLAKAYLFTLFLEVARFHSKMSEADTSFHTGYWQSETGISRIAPVLDYIEENYMNPISVEELAQICHLSLTHFRRTFESVMHISPLYYLISVRIEKACDFLVNTDANILAIAQMAGFSTPSNFHRQFGRMMRITPSEYRRSMREGKLTADPPNNMEYNGWLEPEADPGQET